MFCSATVSSNDPVNIVLTLSETVGLVSEKITWSRHGMMRARLTHRAAFKAVFTLFFAVNVQMLPCCDILCLFQKPIPFGQTVCACLKCDIQILLATEII